MSVLLSILLTIVALLGILLGLLLVMPIEVRVEGQVDEERFAGEVRARWAFGLLGLRLSSSRASGLTVCGWRVAGLPRRGEKRARPAPRKQQETRKSGRGLGWALAHREGMKRVVRRLGGTLGLRFELRGQLGLGDPADTVLVSQLLAELARRAPGLRLDLGWDYVDDVLELDGEGRARIWPVQILGVGLLLLLDREVRALLRSPAKGLG